MDTESDKEGDAADKVLSREGSFFSLTSNSTYYTAKDDLDLDSAGGGLDKAEGHSSNKPVEERSKGQSSSSKRLSVSSNESSATLGEAESIGSSGSVDLEDFTHLSSESSSLDPGEGQGQGPPRPMSSSEENAVEVREDISRICNSIAESSEVDTDKDKVKRTRIDLAVRSKDLTELRILAVTDGGLLSNALRTPCWPLLLDVSLGDLSQDDYKKIPKHFPDVPDKIVNLVSLDVARVLRRFPPGLTDPQQDHLLSYLTHLICSILQENRSAYYYQGFHDISLTFLLVSISQHVPYLAYLCLDKMIRSNLDPYMEKTMEKTHDVLHVLFSLLELEDSQLFRKIVIDCKCPVAFSLPWVLTWFSHTLPNDTDVFRVYDFILGSQKKVDPPYLIPIFVSAALILRNGPSIKRNPELTEIASMHHTLSKLPSELDSLEPWLKECTKLMDKYKGKESQLLSRGLKIKTLQNKLWEEEPSSSSGIRPRPPPPSPPGIFLSLSRFLFVRYRWVTIPVVVAVAAYYLQTKYGRSISSQKIKSVLDSYSPEPLRPLVKYWFPTDESGAE